MKMFAGRRFSLTRKVFGKGTSVGSVVAGVLRNRLSRSLTSHAVGRGASLHARYGASPLLPPRPTPDQATRVVMDSHLRRRGTTPSPSGLSGSLTSRSRRAVSLYPGKSGGLPAYGWIVFR